MSRCEEPSDGAKDSLKLSPSRATSPALSPSTPPAAALQSTPFPAKVNARDHDGTAPALPPQMASVRSHTADEIVQMMNRTPLFMTSLENAGEDAENVELEAMRALQYEGTPAEIAQGFKEQGNEMAKAKRWKDGKEFYTKGIAVLMQEEKKPEEASEARSGEGEREDSRNQKGIGEACYVNRALCNLELSTLSDVIARCESGGKTLLTLLAIENYRSTTLDCASALRLNPKNTKAYYRSSSALLALDKIAEASDACTRGLTMDPNNAALKTLYTKIKAREAALSTAHQKKQQEAELAQRTKITLATALRARNIRTRTTAQPPDMEDAAIHLAPDALSPTSTLHFPVVLLYPLDAQSDFIKAFPETDTVPKHLAYIFPLPWDEKHEYTSGGVEFYMETGSGGLIKVGRNVSLGKVLGSGGVEVVDGIVRINILPKGRTAGWIEEMKIRKGK